MKRVELETAFMWRCPDCRTRNFEAAVDRELTDEEKAALISQYGNGDDDFELVGAPEIVHCEKCGMKFRTCEDNSVELN